MKHDLRLICASEHRNNSHYQRCDSQHNNVHPTRQQRPSPQKMSSLLSSWHEPRLCLTTIMLMMSLLSFGLVCLDAIRLQPEGRDKYYWSGEQFVITCQNNNNIKNVKIRWIGPDGRDIVEDRSLRVHTESATPHGHRLIVMNASATTDSGPYKCTIGGEGDKHAKESTEFALHIHHSIDFGGTSTRHSVQAGERAMLTCRVVFDPEAQATVTWLRDRRPIESFEDHAFTVKEYNEQTQASLLLVRPVARHHDATYTCRASAITAALSQLREHDIRLDVQYAPTFDAPSRTVWVPAANHEPSHGKRPISSKSREVTLRCVSYANPAPRLEWINARTGQPLSRGSPAYVLDITDSSGSSSSSASTSAYNSAGRRRFDSYSTRARQQDSTVEQLDNRTSSTLRIAYNSGAVNLGDDSQATGDAAFTCTAHNALGTAQKTFNVAPGAAPPAYKAMARRYEPATAQLELTIYGPDPPAITSHQQQLATPPVDAFRIRVAGPSMPVGSNSASLASLPAASQSSPSSGGAFVTFSAVPIPLVQASTNTTGVPVSTNKHGKQNVVSAKASSNGARPSQQLARYQAALVLARSPLAHNQQQHQQQLANAMGGTSLDSDLGDDYEDEIVAALAHQALAREEPKWPVNYTLSLATLPSGQHRLWLDAHNAVGWSLNSTLLGEYYIVSDAVDISRPVAFTFTCWASMTLLLFIFHTR